MQALDLDCLLVTTLEEISWLLNLKASGFHEFDPTFDSCCLLTKEDVKLFVRDDSYSDLQDLSTFNLGEIKNHVQMLEPRSKIGIDGQSCNYGFSQLFENHCDVKYLNGASFPVS